MRTIDEIKQTMCQAFMDDSTLAGLYGFKVGDAWSSHFSPVSIESLILYVIAVGIYTVEALLYQHKSEVDTKIDNMSVHRPRWYRDKVLSFLKGVSLIADTDRYDTDSMSLADIEKARVVKYAAATESDDASILTIKVATESNGELAPLDDETERQLCAYIAEVKDAGVRIALVNQEADSFSCVVDVLYDPIQTKGFVEERVRKAIISYIGNLPFNGEYSNMALTDELQRVDGVRIVQLRSSSVKVHGESSSTEIDIRHTPAAGYMKLKSITINMTPYR